MGFMVVGGLIGKLKGKVEHSFKYESDLYSATAGGGRIFFQMPATYMNLSGKAVARFMRVEAVLPEELLVVCDDLDLPFGKLRMRSSGASGGHRGLESIIAELGTANFNRLRVGIGGVAKALVVDHVLSPFSEDEQIALPDVLEAAGKAVMTAVRRGVPTAMNQYNNWVLKTEEEKPAAARDGGVNGEAAPSADSPQTQPAGAQATN